MDVGQPIINGGFISAAAYLPRQFFTLITGEGRWRWLALLALGVLLPVFTLAAVVILLAKTLWPLVLSLASVLASMYLTSRTFLKDTLSSRSAARHGTSQ